MSKKKAAASRKAALTLFLVGATTVIPIAMSHQAAYAANTTGTISGTVRNDAGQPVANVLVTVTPGGQRVRTDTSGSYSISGIEAGTYTVTTQLVTFKPQSVQLSVTQDNTTAANFTLEKLTITGRSRVAVNAVQRTSTPTSYTINTKIEQETKSQPNNLYQFPGLVFGQPGVTPDAGGYVHIRGSDINQVGFNVDGIQITEPITNTFATNLVTVGLKSAQLYTGGADASYGNATGGYINLVTNNGRDLRGGVTEGTLGPGHGWNYNGTNTQYGNVTPNGKFDYYASTIAFKNGFPSGINGLQKLNASFDGILKFNYYADPNNTFTAFYSQGFEQYDNYQPNPDPTMQNLKFNEHLGSTENIGRVSQDHDDQSYNFSYVSYKHNFDPKSFLTYRLFNLRSELTLHAESLSGAYENRHSDQIGNQIDYSNNLKPNDSLRVGFALTPATTKYRLIQSLSGAPMPTLANDQSYGYQDRISRVSPTKLEGYLTNQFRTPGNKITLDTGVRLAQDRYGLKQFGSFTKHYVDPRLGLVYSPDPTLKFSTSLAESSQFADTRLEETLFPEDRSSGVGTFTSLNPGNPADFVGLDPNRLSASKTVAASRYTQYGRFLSRYRQINELSPQKAHNFDLGFAKSFTLSGVPIIGGDYAVSATGYRHQQYDLIQQDRLFYVAPTRAAGGQIAGNVFGQRTYNTGGKGHASGLEFQLSKRARNPNDFNGFITYTNQIAKATNSDYDTGYTPYFNFTFGSLGRQLGLNDAQYRALNNTAYSTSYDQRHTVAVVANKRINKFFEESAVLDAGSGFPFVAAVSQVGGGAGVDPQRLSQGFGNATFGEVPIVLADQKTVAPLNPVVGRSGWHYKISLNSSIILTPDTSLFVNVDNVFDKKTVLTYSTSDASGALYYIKPTAEFPQGRVYYGPSTILTPVFFTVGFRHKF